MSPELIDPQRIGLKNSRPTKSSDCYALGMVIYETISGHFPFHEDADLTVFMKVLKGERPPREALFTNSLWMMLERRWEPQPDARPSIEDVLRCLEMEVEIVILTRGLDAETDDEDEYDWSSVSDSSGKLSHSIPSANFCGPYSYADAETPPTGADSNGGDPQAVKYTEYDIPEPGAARSVTTTSSSSGGFNWGVTGSTETSDDEN